jgi:hypothetical protein
VLEVTDVKQSKAKVGGSKGNRSYAKKKRDKVDGEAVRSENVMGFAMCVAQNTSNGVQSVPKKVKKASPSDSVSGLQNMAEKKLKAAQQKIVMAGKKLEFAEKKEERRSKDMVECFALEHRRIDTQQQHQQQQQQQEDKKLELQRQQQQLQMQMQQQQIKEIDRIVRHA